MGPPTLPPNCCCEKSELVIASPSKVVSVDFQSLGAPPEETAPMKRVRAGFGDHVQRTASGSAKLGREAIGEHLKLFHRLLRDHELLGLRLGPMLGQRRNC